MSLEMNATVIDMPVFRDLQDAAGAEFVAELIGTFFEEAPALLGSLRAAQAQAQADAEGFRRAAHSLKTNAQTFGAMALGEQARALELAGPPAGAAALDALEAAYASAAAALEALRHG
jgi:HPt (histidine-containing phosphotransfer) domain-containing protein